MKKDMLNFRAGVARLAVVPLVACVFNAAAHAADISVLDGGGITFSASGGWEAKRGAGFSGGYAAYVSEPDSTPATLTATVKGAGTLTFKWKWMEWLNVNVYVNGSYESLFSGSVTSSKWYEKTIAVYAAAGEEQTIEWQQYATSGTFAVSDFKWTPAPEAVQINFDTRGGGACEPMVVNPGQTVYAKDLPIPTHGDWTFAGWYIPGDYNWIAEQVDVIDVSLSDVTVYAQWKLPVSVFDEDGVAFKPTGDCYATVGGWDWMTPWWTMQADSNLCANIEIPWDRVNTSPKTEKSTMTATVHGPAIVSFDMAFDCFDSSLLDVYSNIEGVEILNDGSAKFSFLLDDKKQLEWSKSSSAHNEKISIPTGTHKLVFELTGTPTLMDLGDKNVSDFCPSATVKNFKYLEVAPQETFGAWANTLRDNGAWIKGDLPRFAKAYEERLAANPDDYEAHILHAVTILAQLAESKTVADYAKKFGFTLDYLRMKVDGSLAKPSSWPAVNATVDQFVKEAVPVIKDALADLEAIPDDWTGTVSLSADEYPVDEDTEIDIGDVLYARAGLETSIGLAYFAHGYDLTVDYAKADKALASGDSVASKLLKEQTKFMAKVRNASSLPMSKSWMAAALNRALLADAAVLAREDCAMHFIEYDLEANGDMIDRARNLTQKALASLAAPQGVDVQGEVLGDKEVPFDVSLLPVGDDGLLQVYLGALFEGKITRDILPAFQNGADGSPVPVMETIKDPTICGLLPDFTTRTWTGILKELGREVAHQTVTVKLDANGGKTSVKSVSFDYDDEAEGCLYPELPVPTKAGGIFAGWATAKTGGEIVRAGDFYDAGLFAGAKAPTLYAQWIATYALTVKGEGAYAEWDWSDEQYESLPQEVFDGEAASETDDKGVVNVPAGALVRVYAADSAEDKRGNELVFQKWNVSSSKANLGAGFQVGEHETTLVMPPEKLTLTATYIDESTCGWLCAEAWADEVNLGWNDDLGEDVVIYPPYDAFEWSPDGGKTWFKSGDYALLKAGAYTVSWRSTDANWVSASATKEKVMVYAGNDSWASLSAFSYVPEVVVDVMTVEGGTCTLSSLGGSVTMNPKDGLVPVGKAIALTAKASKNYAFQGWAFAKSWQYGEAFAETAATWKLDGGYASSSGLLSYIDPLDLKVHVVAVFKALSDYSAADILFARFEGWSSCAEVTYDGSGNASVDIKAVVGCALDDDYALVCGPLASPLTYKLDGKLPDGLKFDAKTGVLSGAPKKAGSTVVKIMAIDPAKNVKSITVNFIVSQLPKWLVGEFRGVAEGHQFGFSDTAYGDPRQCGILELSVKSDGKVSAKIITCHGAGSVSGTLSWADDTFWFFGGKNGWYCNPIYFNPDGTIDGTINSYDKQSGTIVAQITGMRQDKDLLVDSPFIGKYYTFAFASATASDYDESQVQSGYGYLTIKTDKNGAAKVTGQLPDGEKVSVSALLMPVSANESVSARLYLFASPSSYKKEDWFVMTLNIDPDGGVVSEEGAVWTVPDTYAYKEYYYGITDDYSPVDVGIYGKGALYSEAKTLEGYYWTACCEYSDQVRQQYSYKDGGWTYYDDESALVLNDYFFNVVVKGDNKGAISLVEKSPAPWIDDDAWNFWEDKKGDAITDPSQLSISFAKATGIFTGKASAYFEYPKPTSASLPYSGVMIDEGDDVYRGYGSAVYTYKYSYYDGKAKTDTKKITLPVSLDPADAPVAD